MIFSPFPRCHEFPILIGLINCSAYADPTFGAIIPLNTDIKAVRSSVSHESHCCAAHAIFCCEVNRSLFGRCCI